MIYLHDLPFTSSSQQPDCTLSNKFSDLKSISYDNNYFPLMHLTGYKVTKKLFSTSFIILIR